MTTTTKASTAEAENVVMALRALPVAYPGLAQGIANTAASLIASLKEENERLDCNLDALRSDHNDLREMLIEANEKRKTAEAQVATLTERVRDFAKAVEPFAEFARYWDGLATPDDRKFISVGDVKLTVGDLRRVREARASLASQQKDGR